MNSVQAGLPLERVAKETDCAVHPFVGRTGGDGFGVAASTGHYLLWELTKELMTTLVIAAVEADEAEQAEYPYTPIAFEVDGEGTVPGIGSGESLKIRGRIDGLDGIGTPAHSACVDYKFKVGSAMKPEDRYLLQSAVRGYRLQPPFYSCLTVAGEPLRAMCSFCFSAPVGQPDQSLDL